MQSVILTACCYFLLYCPRVDSNVTTYNCDTTFKTLIIVTDECDLFEMYNELGGMITEKFIICCNQWSFELVTYSIGTDWTWRWTASSGVQDVYWSSQHSGPFQISLAVLW
jgi:hypothetical protein